MSGTLMPAPWFTGQDDDGRIISNGLLWTYAAGTDDEVLTYQDVDLLVPHANPIQLDGAGRAVVYLSPGSSYKFRLEEEATPPAHGALVKEQDDVAAVPGSASAVDFLLQAGEDMVAGEAGYVSDGSGGKTPGKVYKTDADLEYASSTPTVVFATGTVAADALGAFRDAGAVELTGLVTGETYYLSDVPGEITTTPTGTYTRRVGQAKSTTELLATPNPPVTPTVFGSADNIIANRVFN